MSIIQINTLVDLRQQIHKWRDNGERIALVPTMGNLHAGHVQLANRAGEIADRVIVSVFVNPTQFSAGEDLDAYPRTLEADQDKLNAAPVDVLFAPELSTVYPNGSKNRTQIEPPQDLANILCGAFRRGHFQGVATVVNKLLNMVQPDLALFGEKDYQQLMVIRAMVDDLNIPVEVIGVPTVREKDGLAMSSRNQYLSEQERLVAPQMYEILQRAAKQLSLGKAIDDVECQSIQALDGAGFRAEYVSVRCAKDLSDPALAEKNLVILAAARLGGARLIDNLLVTI